MGPFQVPRFLGGGNAEARVPDIYAPLAGGMEWCVRSQAGSIKKATSPVGGHVTRGARAMTASEPPHPASLARQRISPSRRP